MQSGTPEKEAPFFIATTPSPFLLADHLLVRCVPKCGENKESHAGASDVGFMMPGGCQGVRKAAHFGGLY